MRTIRELDSNCKDGLTTAGVATIAFLMEPFILPWHHWASTPLGFALVGAMFLGLLYACKMADR